MSVNYEFFKRKICIVRTYASGVHFGYLEEFDQENMIAHLKNSRRIWNWKGAFTLSEAATHGVDNTSKLATNVEHMIVCQVIELIPCTEKSIQIISNIADYKP